MTGRSPELPDLPPGIRRMLTQVARFRVEVEKANASFEHIRRFERRVGSLTKTSGVTYEAARQMQEFADRILQEIPPQIIYGRAYGVVRTTGHASGSVIGPDVTSEATFEAPPVPPPGTVPQDLILGAILIVYVSIAYICIATQPFPQSLLGPLAESIAFLIVLYEKQG